MFDWKSALIWGTATQAGDSPRPASWVRPPFGRIQVFPLQIKAAADQVFEGWASTPSLDRVGEIVLPTALAAALANYMRNPIVTYAHDWLNPIGRTVEARATEAGLWVRIKLGRTAHAREVWTLIEDRIVRSLSIGFNARKQDGFERDGVWHWERIELLEIAVVPIPANPNAVITIARGLGLDPTPPTPLPLMHPAPDLNDRSHQGLETASSPGAFAPPATGPAVPAHLTAQNRSAQFLTAQQQELPIAFVSLEHMANCQAAGKSVGGSGTAHAHAHHISHPASGSEQASQRAARGVESVQQIVAHEARSPAAPQREAHPLSAPASSAVAQNQIRLQREERATAPVTSHAASWPHAARQSTRGEQPTSEASPLASWAMPKESAPGTATAVQPFFGREPTPCDPHGTQGQEDEAVKAACQADGSVEARPPAPSPDEPERPLDLDALVAALVKHLDAHTLLRLLLGT